jgi:hypothetical protein
MIYIYLVHCSPPSNYKHHNNKGNKDQCSNGVDYPEWITTSISVSVAFRSQAFRIIRNWNEQYNIGLSLIRKKKQQQACFFKKTIKVTYFKMKQSRNYNHFISKMKQFN